MKLLVNAPINSLSFGNVSINILRSLYKKGADLCFFPIGDKTDVSAYDKIDPKDTNIINQLDTFKDLIYTTIYKLENLQ